MLHQITRRMAVLFGLLVSASAFADEYSLTLDRRTLEVAGDKASVLTINGQIPGPELHFREGEDVVINVKNNLPEESSLHWHGILLPPDMDGVPGLNNYTAIPAGQAFTYRFRIRQSGTYWYHAHSGTQEQSGVYGPMVIAPSQPEPVQTQRDYVVMFSDFTATDGNEIIRNLKNDHEHYNRGRRTVSDFFRDLSRQGLGLTLADRAMWASMRMDPTDLADVSGYRFLINGRSTAQNWTGLFHPGERVRLRFINASSMSFLDVRIPGLKMIVVQADGQNVEPVVVDEFRMAPAETYDVIVTPREEKAYAIFAEPIDRSGFVRATLAPSEGMTAELPQRKPRTVLTMADMGMSHDGGTMDHAAMDHGTMDHAAMDSGAMRTPASAPLAPAGWADSALPPGQHALNYAELRAFVPQADTRAPDREIVVRLGGSMSRYVWTMDGHDAAHAHPLELKYNERVRLTFVNDTMMAHPMHLHGMFVQLDNGQPADRQPSKHTVIVPPGKSYAVLLTANEPGDWAFHCHLLYHMANGMMTNITVARFQGAEAR